MTTGGDARTGDGLFDRLRLRSLSLRLVVSALAWIAIVLVVAWFGLVALFRNHLEADLDARAQFDLNRLIAALAVDEQGDLLVEGKVASRIFAKPYSGRYWQVAFGTGEDGGTAAEGPAGAPADDPASAGQPLRSRSLWDQSLPLDMPPPDADGISRWREEGPAGQNLLLLGRRIVLPDASEEVLAVVGRDRATIPAAVEAFAWQLGVALAGLAAGLAIAIGLQVWFGLAPLRRLRAALGRLRGGAAPRVEGRWPGEVAPLVDDLNAVLTHNEAVVARARTQAGDLAHALKTPIAVLANAASSQAADLPELVEQQSQAMRRQIDRHLARARAAGSAERPGARADLGEVAGGLVRAMRRLHARPGLELALQAPPARILFHGDREDAAEILGCILDNACTWAAGQVRLTLSEDMPAAPGAEPQRRFLQVTVEDDGPGLSPDARNAVLGRGVRLDESVPGSGLGLAIVRDLVAIYEGGLTLDASPLGGLRVALRLPGHLETEEAKRQPERAA
ncbi:MAG: sensor histidine kinase [Sneathiellaceae bacterium]